MKLIDAFGDLRIDGNRIKARLIQISALMYAAFSSDNPQTPLLITAVSPPTVQGRNVTVELIGGGQLEFRRAGCGCQTPSSLRGPSSRFTALIPQPAEA